MKPDNTYSKILEQAFSPEFAGLHAGEPGFTEIAEALSDDLYRLSIEFGVPFNDFKARVLEEVLNHSRLHQGDPESDQQSITSPLLVHAAVNLPILVFALELMPDDDTF